MDEKQKSNEFLLQYVAVAVTWACMLGVAAYFVMAFALSDTPLDILGISLIGKTWFVVFGIPPTLILLGFVHGVHSKSSRNLFAWALSAAGVIPAIIIFVSTLSDCDVNYSIKQKMAKILSESELKSVRPGGWMCPTIFHYQRDIGEGNGCAFGSQTWIRGTKVWIGDCG